MKIQISVGVGLAGCTRKETIEIDDYELEGLAESERDKYIEEYAQECMFNMIEWNWKMVE